MGIRTINITVITTHKHKDRQTDRHTHEKFSLFTNILATTEDESESESRSLVSNSFLPHGC